METGGSRELPSAMQLYGPGVNEPKAAGKIIALGRSREPPALTGFGWIRVATKIRGATGCGQKRLPFSALGTNKSCRLTTPFEDEDDDEDDYDTDPLHTQQLPLPIHQHPRSRLRLSGYCLQNSP